MVEKINNEKIAELKQALKQIKEICQKQRQCINCPFYNDTGGCFDPTQYGEPSKWKID